MIVHFFSRETIAPVRRADRLFALNRRIDVGGFNGIARFRIRNAGVLDPVVNLNRIRCLQRPSVPQYIIVAEPKRNALPFDTAVENPVVGEIQDVYLLIMLLVRGQIGWVSRIDIDNLS